MPNGGDCGSCRPSRHKLRWLDELLALASSFSGPVVVHRRLQRGARGRTTPIHRTESGWLGVLPSAAKGRGSKAFLEAGFADSFRSFNPTGKAYTWWDYREGAFRRNMGMRLDLVLASRAAMPLFDSVETRVACQEPGRNPPTMRRSCSG
ncbi:MAG: hypothetical protein MZV70_22545 [Desulfobacterales bacterium]|nr:hypothetical protein [Desulfobacterales bacterium]